MLYAQSLECLAQKPEWFGGELQNLKTLLRKFPLQTAQTDKMFELTLRIQLNEAVELFVDKILEQNPEMFVI